MGRRVTAAALTLTAMCWGAGNLAIAQTAPPFVPEFKLLCHPTETVSDVPPADPSADPFGKGPWYVNDDRSIWAGWQPLVSGEAGNRIMWIKPPGQKLEITGRRLDGEAGPLGVQRNDSYLSKGFEPNRVIFRAPGCWELTGTAGGHKLVFVVEVAAPREDKRR